MNSVLIVNPSNRTNIYQGLADEFAAVEPPVWPRLIASYLEAKGIPVEIIDAQVLKSSQGQLARIIAEDIKPAMVVVAVYSQQPSASTQTMPAAIEFCEALNRWSGAMIPLVVVGTHPAALPAQTLKETNADAVCTGEGFASIEQIYRMIETRADLWKYFIRPENPLGICYWDHGEPMFTNPAPLIWNMEEIPGGQWDKLSGMKMGAYRAHNWHTFGYEHPLSKSKYASIYTSLGCPFSCRFCCIQAPFREGDGLKLKGRANSYRLWPAQRVVDEIVELVSVFHVKHIKIADEMFLLNRAHVREICEGLLARGLNERHLNIWFYSRVDTVGEDRGLLELMRKAGFSWAALGIESVQSEVLGNVDKRDYGAVEIEAAVRRMRDAGISVIGNYIFGLPGDTAHSMKETLKYAQWLNTEFVNMYCAVAFPGSELFDDLRSRNWRPPPWSAYSFHAYDHEPLPTASLTAPEILKFRDEAFQKYMRADGYQSMIGNKFGAEAIAEVKRMIEVPLARKLLGG